MESSFSEEELIQRPPDGDNVAGDSTQAGSFAELNTLPQKVLQPAPGEQVLDEPELAAAIERALEIGSSAPTEAFRDSPPVAPLKSLGQYELLAEIGAGGMGAVYKARHTRLDRFVALKVLPPARVASQEMLARFEREMRAAGKLHHPNIVAAQDAGEIDGTHFLVMELVEGRDLSALVKQFGPLPIADACEVVRQAATGLQHIHQHGLVHRDLKPSNLMLARQADGPPIVKILDLGLAMFQSSQESAGELTSTGQVLGTVDFMAPEQGLGATHAIDIRADIYSLGATLYKLLTGRAPFEDPKYNTTLKRLRALDEVTPPPVSDLRPECPPELSNLVARLLAKSPSERIATPAELAQLLSPFAVGADLQQLLAKAPMTRTLPTAALSRTWTPASTVSMPDRIGTESATTANQSASRGRWLSGYRGLALLGGTALTLVLLAVIVVLTDRGELVIDVPDELERAVSVKLLRGGKVVDDNWQIKTGKNQRRIRSGRVEVKLPAEVAQDFVLNGPDELLVKRNGELTLKLTRRERTPQTVSAETPPNYELDLSSKTDDGWARVEFKERLKLDDPLTVEMFVTPRSFSRGSLQPAASEDQRRNRSLFAVGSALVRLKQLDRIWQWVVSPEEAQPASGRRTEVDVYHKSVQPGRRFHLAGVMTSRELRLFVDGRLESRKVVEVPLRSDMGAVELGWQSVQNNDPNWEPFDGTIDEVRISTSARYDRDFKVAERLTADESTWGLYHCDEGSGDVLTDSSGHGHHGKVIGAKWVRLDEPVVSPSPVKPSAATPSQTVAADIRLLQIAEPPPLDEWLKGRTIVPVSQDGQGAHRTIQSALDALEPGQVVKVLDAGPYRETLKLEFVPKDCGLVSEVQTAIELLPSEDGPGLHFGANHNFRVSGIRFRGTATTREAPLAEWVSPVGLVIEDCAFQLELRENLSYRAVDVQLTGTGPRAESVLFRECLFECGDLNFLGRGDRAEIFVTRNLFGLEATLTLSKIDRIHRMLFRYNICANRGPIFRQLKEVGEQLELSNNSMIGNLTKFNFLLPETGVVLRNNFSQVGIQFFGGDLEPRTQPPHQWLVSHNFSGFTTKNNVPNFLSLDPPNPNYLRPIPGSSLATRGAGGDWPSYVGALTPGSTPASGDWFTRLRERWGGLKPTEAKKETSGPTKIDEPPPLDEWLKGRTILTVAQDGNGQFTTIQAALDALQSGQVVKVLDQGPYRETMRLAATPRDTGLISEKNTVLELPQWDGEVGHELSAIKGFRLSGFEMIFPERKDGVGLKIHDPDGFVLENCRVQMPMDNGIFTRGVMLTTRRGGFVDPIVVRECLFDGRLGIDASKSEPIEVFIVRNYFLGQTERRPSLQAVGQFHKLAIRHNVLAGQPEDVISLYKTKGSDVVSVSNNTFVSPYTIIFTDIPEKSVGLCNNLFAGGGNFGYQGESATEVPAEVQQWEIARNVFQKRLRNGAFVPFPASATGEIAAVSFLAQDPHHPDYLRIAKASPLATGGAGGSRPSYIGAFPPGPAPADGDWFTRLRERWGD